MTHANQREKTRKQQWVLTYCNYRSLLVSHSLLVSLVSLVSHAVTCLFHCQPLSDLFVSLSATSCFTCVTSCQPLSHLSISLSHLFVSLPPTSCFTCFTSCQPPGHLSISLSHSVTCLFHCHSLLVSHVSLLVSHSATCLSHLFRFLSATHSLTTHFLSAKLLRYTWRPPNRNTSLSSVTQPSTSPSASSQAHSASACGHAYTKALNIQPSTRRLGLSLRACTDKRFNTQPGTCSLSLEAITETGTQHPAKHAQPQPTGMH